MERRRRDARIRRLLEPHRTVQRRRYRAHGAAAGVVGGLDVTLPHLLFPTDAWVVGVLGGDTESNADFFDLDSTDAFNNTTGLRLTNLTVTDNLNYKYDFSQYWIEPTVGFSHPSTIWDAAALAIGLTNGNDWRVRGGASARHSTRTGCMSSRA